MRGVRAIAATVALAVAGGGAVSWRAGADSDRAAGVPTFAVARVRLVRRVVADGSLRAVTAAPVVAPETACCTMKLAWLALDGSVVAKGDVVARFDSADTTKQLREAEADVAAADTMVRQERSTAASAIDARDNELAIATDDAVQQQRFHATDPEIYSRNQIITADVDLRLAAAQQAYAVLAARVQSEVSRDNVELVELDRKRSALALDRATEALASLVVRAPSAGVVVLHRDYDGAVPHPGAQVNPGQELAEIPDVSAMEAELFVLEVEGDGLEVGQSVDVVITSRPTTTFRGAVRFVDKAAKPRIPGVPVQYFSVVVSFAATDRDAMKPGQRVRGRVAISDERAIVVPRQAVFERGGGPVVYRRDARGFTRVSVELGPATPGRVVVVAGLADGDAIALRDPVEVSR